MFKGIFVSYRCAEHGVFKSIFVSYRCAGHGVFNGIFVSSLTYTYTSDAFYNLVSPDPLLRTRQSKTRHTNL